ncbi:unnamed protein product [Scytosiphon promiscuus]
MYSKKFKLLISATGVTSGDIKTSLESRYDILYCGIYSHDEKVHVYIQNKTNMAWSVVVKLVGEMLDIKDISVYKKVEGSLICETGVIPKHGGRRVSTRPRSRASTAAATIINNDNSVDNSVNNNDNSVNNNADQRVAINNFFPVALNPIGKETIDHITAENMASCYTIDPPSNGVVMNFSELLYGLNSLTTRWRIGDDLETRG